MNQKRRLQFSLRTWLVMMVWFALFLGLYINTPNPTFSVQGNVISVECSWPMDSVMFDGDFHLVEHERVPEYLRCFEEQSGSGTYTSWLSFSIQYQESTPAEFLIIHYRYLGYRHYRAVHTAEGLRFHPSPMPPSLAAAIAR